MISRKLDQFFAKDDTSRYLVRRLVAENFQKYRKQYILAFIFMGLVAATTALSAWIMRDVVNQIFVDKDLGKVLMISGVVMTIFIVKGAATYAQSVIMARVGNAIVAEQQKKLYAHILTQGADFFQEFPASELITRVSHNAQAVRNVLNTLIVSIGRDVFALIGLVAVMVIQDPVLSFIAFFIAPPAIFVVARLVKRVKRIAKEEFLSLTKINQTMQETALGYRIVRAFGLQSVVTDRMDDAIEGVQLRANKIAALSARTSPLMETLGGIAIALIILYSGWRTIVGGQSPGEFISFLTAMLLAYDPAKRLSRLQVNIEGALVGVRMMFEILDRPSKLIEKQDAETLTAPKGEIKFENVEFSYGSEDKVLKDLSLTAEGGKRTALVGPSGGGKSTLLALVQRFYDVKGGSVSIDGTDVRECSLGSLNDQIALVTQDTVLFTGTIRDNIRFGRQDASEEDIIQAAKDAHAHEFILEQPDGYDTMIGENGASLSGGQRQRLAIARAIIKDAKIVLLDEATSALDSESEAKVQDAFERLSEGRTTLVIAHRLSTIRDADKICVIKAGELIEEGDHKSLMAENGQYARLVQLQFSE